MRPKTHLTNIAHVLRQCITLSMFTLAPVVASAQGVTGLFNTGVDAGGVKLAGGATDTHYQVLENGNAQAIVLLNSSPYAVDATSAYIWQTSAGTPINVTRTFRTTFTISAGFNPLTAIISGQWSTDNAGLDILVNGVSSGATSPGFGSFTGFSISGAAAGFVLGVNTLDFKVQDVGVIAGFAVRNLAGSAQSITQPPTTVPEPSTITLMMLGVAAIGTAAARRKRA